MIEVANNYWGSHFTTVYSAIEIPLTYNSNFRNVNYRALVTSSAGREYGKDLLQNCPNTRLNRRLPVSKFLRELFEQKKITIKKNDT